MHKSNAEQLYTAQHQAAELDKHRPLYSIQKAQSQGQGSQPGNLACMHTRVQYSLLVSLTWYTPR